MLWDLAQLVDRALCAHEVIYPMPKSSSSFAETHYFLSSPKGKSLYVSGMPYTLEGQKLVRITPSRLIAWLSPDVTVHAPALTH